MKEDVYRRSLFWSLEMGDDDGSNRYLFARVFEYSQEGICITNPQGNIIYVNPAFTKTTGYSMAEVLGKNPRILKSGRHNQEFYRKMWQDLTSKGQWRNEIWNRRKNGEIYPEMLNIHAVLNESGVLTHYVAIFRDITEDMQLRKEVELAGQIQKNILRGDLDHEKLRMKSIFLPYHHLSGDYYDYRWDEKNLIFRGFLFDVMGHGVASALQNSALRVLFRQVVSQRISLPEKVVWMNHEAQAILPADSFAAGIFFDLDLNNKTLTFVTAGINQFIFFSKKNSLGCEVISQPGLFLGISEHAEYEEHVIPFNAGDGMIFLTDGFLDLIREKEYPLHQKDLESLFQWLKDMGESKELKDDGTAISLIHL